MRRRAAVTEPMLEAAQLGDPLAIQEVLESCEVLTRNLVWQRGHPMPADFDDRCQEVRMALWRYAIPGFDPRCVGNSGHRAVFETYAFWRGLGALGPRIRADAIRLQRVRPETDLSPGESTAEGDDGEGDRTSVLDAVQYLRSSSRDMIDAVEGRLELQDELFSCIRKLTEQEQRVLFYRFWEGKTLREIEAMSRDGKHGLQVMSRTQLGQVQARALGRLRVMFEVKAQEV